MDEINKIKKEHFKEGKTINAVARKYKRSWATVNNLVNAKEEDLSSRGKRPNRQKSLLTDKLKDRINELLDISEHLRSSSKQKYTTVYLYKKLCEEGLYHGSERYFRYIVADILAQRVETKKKNTYLKLDFEPGQCLQVDHGPCEVHLNNEKINGYLFVASVPGMVLRFAQYYPTKASEAWGMFHEMSFRFFRGIFQTCMYDNDTVLKNPQTDLPTSFFNDLTNHYGFEGIFCNKAAGWEKGSVENSVGYMRRNFLAGVQKFEDLKSLNSYLLRSSLKDMFESKHYKTKEALIDGYRSIKEHLIPFNNKRIWGKWVHLPVSPMQTITFDGNEYSVDEKYVSCILKTFVSIYSIEIYNEDNQHVYSHARQWGKNKDVLVLDHYLDQLIRKPKAIDFAKVLKNQKFDNRIGKLRKCLAKKYDSRKANHEFILILDLARKYKKSDFETAIEMAFLYGGVTFSAIKTILKQLTSSDEIAHVPALLLPEKCHINLDKEYNPSKYSTLLGGNHD